MERDRGDGMALSEESLRIVDLAMIDGEEALRMVAAWPRVPAGLSGRPLVRAWARLADVAEVRARRKAPGLLGRICRPDRTVPEEAQKFVAMALFQAAGAPRRKRDLPKRGPGE